jgi:hypothetical protein
MKKFTCTAAVATLALTLTGCGQTASPSAGETGTNRPSSSSPSSSSSSSSAPDAVETEEPAPEDTEFKFGESVKFDDGLSVTISKPKAFKPSQYAAFDKEPAYVRITITVVNKTGATYDPSAFYATLQSANVEATSVYDSDKKIEGGPQTKLLKNREAKWDLGFGVKNPKDLVLEVTPGFEYNSVIFTS